MAPCLLCLDSPPTNARGLYHAGREHCSACHAQGYAGRIAGNRVTAMLFRVLGPVQLLAGDTAVHLKRAQRRAILAYLVLHRHEYVSAGQFTEALWGGAAPSTADAQIHNAISEIRSVLRDLGRDGMLYSGPGGHRLEVPEDDVDLGRFTAMISQARDREAADAIPLIKQALALWVGVPLSSANAAFVESARSDLELLRRQTIEWLCELELGLGNHREILPSLVGLRQQFPLSETLAAQTMIAYFRSGRVADALEVYRALRDQLAGELGLTPGSELEQVHRKILGHDRSLGAPLLASGRCYLPRAITDFTGRLSELAILNEPAPSLGGSQVIAITAVAGVGGVGKTALAVEWANRNASKYPDGQLYLDLRGFGTTAPMSTSEALGHLLAMLEVPVKDVPADVDDAAALYRATVTGRRLLLLLDNARDAQHVRPLLPVSHGSLALVTSRNQMLALVAKDAARRIDLSMLPTGDALTLLRQIIGTDRVDAEPAAAQELVAACGHLPLAIRICAAQLVSRPGYQLRQAASDLSSPSRLSRLQVDEDAALTTVLEHSYAPLGRSAQRVFQLLSLIPGDVSVPAAQAVCGLSRQETVTQLGVLTQSSLLTESGDSRYVLHDLVKLYASHLLHAQYPQAERAEAFARLGHHYLSAARTASLAAYPKFVLAPSVVDDDRTIGDEQEAKTWLYAEMHNVTAYVELAAQRQPGPQVWLLADAMRGFFSTTHNLALWKRTAQATTDAAQQTADPLGLAIASNNHANYLRASDRHREAIVKFETAASSAQQADWATGEMTALGNAGVSYAHLGQTHKAIEYFERAAAHGDHAGLPHTAVRYRGNVAVARELRGEFALAATEMRKIIEFHHEMGDQLAEARMIANLGVCLCSLGDLVTAQSLLEKANTIHTELGDLVGILVTIGGLAEVHTHTGQLASAERYAQRATSLARELGLPHLEGEAHRRLAEIMLARHDIPAAHRLCDQAHELATSVAEAHELAHTAILKARIHAADGQFELAAKQAFAALGAASKNGLPAAQARARIALAEVYLAQQAPDQAITEAEHISRIATQTQNPALAKAATDLLTRARHIPWTLSKSTGA